MEAFAKMALNFLTQKVMNNGGGATQANSPYHSAKSIAQLFKGA